MAKKCCYFFLAEGAAQARRSKWDNETLCATSNLDLELDATANESSDKGWLPELQLEILDFDTANLEWQTNLQNRVTDADSISTFASKKRNYCKEHNQRP